tara:strand:- start:562 stop:744 length:183 start_codon:yes stop_codon:yes gene_type:complete
MNEEELNTHDPHNEYVWADTTPTWVTVLKWVGLTTAFISGAIGMAIGCYLFTIIMFQIGG